MIVKLEKSTFDYYLYRILLTKKIFEKRKRLLLNIWLKIIIILIPIFLIPGVLGFTLYLLIHTENPNFLFLFLGYPIMSLFYLCYMKHPLDAYNKKLISLEKERLTRELENYNTINQNLIFYHLSKKIRNHNIFDSNIIDIISEYN